MTGKVKWFNYLKGFGFVTGEDGKDIFLHKSDVPSNIKLVEGMPVEFEIGAAPKGTKAINLKVQDV